MISDREDPEISQKEAKIRLKSPAKRRTRHHTLIQNELFTVYLKSNLIPSQITQLKLTEWGRDNQGLPKHLRSKPKPCNRQIYTRIAFTMNASPGRVKSKYDKQVFDKLEYPYSDTKATLDKKVIKKNREGSTQHGGPERFPPAERIGFFILSWLRPYFQPLIEDFRRRKEMLALQKATQPSSSGLLNFKVLSLTTTEGSQNGQGSTEDTSQVQRSQMEEKGKKEAFALEKEFWSLLNLSSNFKKYAMKLTVDVANRGIERAERKRLDSKRKARQSSRSFEREHSLGGKLIDSLDEVTLGLQKRPMKSQFYNKV